MKNILIAPVIIIILWFVFDNNTTEKFKQNPSNKSNFYGLYSSPSNKRMPPVNFVKSPYNPNHKLVNWIQNNLR